MHPSDSCTESPDFTYLDNSEIQYANDPTKTLNIGWPCTSQRFANPLYTPTLARPQRATVRRPQRLSCKRSCYDVGWICPDPIDLAFAMAMLDDVHPSLPQRRDDPNTYTLGRIGHHNVVIACLPPGRPRTAHAVAAATNMSATFPCLRIRLLVGTAALTGGDDTRLGDVVVGEQVVEYDGNAAVSKTTAPAHLLTAAAKLQAIHERYPSSLSDTLANHLGGDPSLGQYLSACLDGAEPAFKHKSPRHRRHGPAVHHGSVATGRFADVDEVALEGAEALCVETEAGCLMAYFPCLVVMGLGADSEDKSWDRCASAAAAAYARELVSVMPVAQS